MSESDRTIIATLAAGRIPQQVPADCELTAELQALTVQLEEIRRFALGLASGDLSLSVGREVRGPVIGSLKALQASLRHLTWQAQRIAEGDLSQRVDFMGDFAAAFNRMVEQLAERRRLEDRLRQAQKLEAVGQLAAGLAHEINTPAQFVSDNLRFLIEVIHDLFALLSTYRHGVAELASAPGFAATIEKLTEAEEAADITFIEEEAMNACTSALDGVERIASIVGAMKDFAVPDQRGKAPADLNRALQATLTVALEKYRDVAEVLTDFGELPLVSCHVGDLNQAFLQLILNAAQAIRDAAPSGSGKGLITVRTRAEPGVVRVEISDTGVGIPQDICDRILEPFFTTREVGSGSGLGLAIARSIVVDKHKGELSLESVVGTGTTLTLSIPVG